MLASEIETMGGGGATGGDRAIILYAYLRIGLVAATLVPAVNVGVQRVLRPAVR